MLDNYYKKELITIKIKNITEGSYDNNILYNKAFNKNKNISYYSISKKFLENDNIMNKTTAYLEIKSYYFDYYYYVLYCYSYPSTPENFTFNVTFNIKSVIKIANNKSLEVIKEYSFIA